MHLCSNWLSVRFLSDMEEKEDATSFEDLMSVLEPGIHSVLHFLRNLWKVVIIVHQLLNFGMSI